MNLLYSVFEMEAFWVVVVEKKMDTDDKWDNTLLLNVVVVVAAVVDCWSSWNEEEEVGPSICLLL